MKDKRKAYEEKIDAQLEEWNTQIVLLKARTKLHELKTAGDEAWEDLKTDAEKAWAEVKTVFLDATAKFK